MSIPSSTRYLAFHRPSVFVAAGPKRIGTDPVAAGMPLPHKKIPFDKLRVTD
jgi:hypothetical protein